MHKSKQRVRDHGEVFTNAREVNAMLDLVKQETERIDSRFLEPACGTGNFLAEVLRRKQAIVEKRYKKSQLEYERYALVAVSSIYGIDILEDNVDECRASMFEIFDERYTKLFKGRCKESCRETVKFVLSRNISWGDALTLKTPDQNAKAIIFSEWSSVNSLLVKRRDFTLANLLENSPPEAGSLFEPLGDKAFIPTPIKEYPVKHFLELGAA